MVEKSSDAKKPYFEMNIRVGDGQPSPFPLKLLQDPLILAQIQEAAINSVIDGYTHIVYNFLRSGDSIL